MRMENSDEEDAFQWLWDLQIFKFIKFHCKDLEEVSCDWLIDNVSEIHNFHGSVVPCHKSRPCFVFYAVSSFRHMTTKKKQSSFLINLYNMASTILFKLNIWALYVLYLITCFRNTLRRVKIVPHLSASASNMSHTKGKETKS
jgi:hypothetical protein